MQRAFVESCKGTDLCWSLHKPVTVGFYRALHSYLRKWPTSRSATKSAVGNFYTLIDLKFQKTVSSRPDNVFMFVQRVASSSKPDSDMMDYGIDAKVHHLQSVVREYRGNLEEMTARIEEQEKELQTIKKNMQKAKAELALSRHALSDVTNKLKTVTKQCDSASTQASKSQLKLEAAITDSIHYEEEILKKNEDLCELVGSLKNEISALRGSSLALVGEYDGSGSSASFCFQTKEGGRVYTNAIRELYYTLLANQLPPAKIETTIKTVLKCFLPSLNIERLELPKESCASYMRREELTTVNLAHNATALLDQAQSGSLSLNSDGTTKFQKKLQGAAINDIVVSVNEVPDGSAESMVADISHELQRLREIAYALRLPNADKINWTLIQSSTSDSASTQKRFNKLLQDKQEEDRERFGPVCADAIQLVENFCCMHLGVNLRKAFFDGLKTMESTDAAQRDIPRADVFVHEFCKLLGKFGVPEYGLGSLAFPDFLGLGGHEPDKASYYQQCSRIKLERQVGSRYFVTAANAGKIIFLCDAAIDFLHYTEKGEKGNKLEQTVFQKLQDKEELANLRVDSLMFHLIYSNLVMLAKSNKLGKNVLDMNKHYLELKMFLAAVEEDPKIAMDRDFRVFPSEDRLYGSDREVNHRLNPSCKIIEDSVFQFDEALFPLLAAGARAMKAKLCSYAQNQLPDGRFWDPNPEIKAILRTLRPNNDVCESILGLNDYLSTAIPNMHQMARSNLIQSKKNKTTQWLNELPCDKKKDVVDLARRNRVQVAKASKEAEAERAEKRREKMMKEKYRRDALARRAILEKERLSKIHMLTSSKELQSVLLEIDQERITPTQKAQKKRSLIRDQINIRKKVLGQKISIPFSKNRKPRSLAEIAREFSKFIEESQSSPEATASSSPDSLVGRQVLHRFNTDGEYKWFSGFVLSYNVVTKLHEIVYEEEEHCFFNLMEDIAQGDLLVFDD